MGTPTYISEAELHRPFIPSSEASILFLYFLLPLVFLGVDIMGILCQKTHASSFQLHVGQDHREILTRLCCCDR